jgi:hypothetical protein
MSGTSRSHAFELWATFHRAPVGPYPEHTSFVVMTCECGAFELFPPGNFELCTPEFRERFEAAAREARWHANQGAPCDRA